MKTNFHKNLKNEDSKAKNLKTKFVLVIAVAFFMLLLSGCVPGDGTYTNDYRAGFFWGLWHGWIAPVSLIIGFFNSDVRIYETMNVGWFYDLGFYIAIISGFGGISLSRRRYRDR